MCIGLRVVVFLLVIYSLGTIQHPCVETSSKLQGIQPDVRLILSETFEVRCTNHAFGRVIATCHLLSVKHIRLGRGLGFARKPGGGVHECL